MKLRHYFLPLIALFFASVVCGQRPYAYDSAWKKIDLLLKSKGLPKSALEAVNKVYAAAKNEKQEDQWVRAAVYRFRLTAAMADEEAFVPADWQNEIAAAPPRVAAVLESAEAEALYLSQRYRGNDQKEVSGDSSTDPRTWTPAHVDSIAGALYLHSLANTDLLKRTPLAGYEAMLIKGNTRYLRPTLYDFLLFRALDYFKFAAGNAGDQSDPRLSDPALFAPAADFIRNQLAAGNRTARSEITLGLYADILQFHLPDGRADAFVDADIDRIAYVYRVSEYRAKDSLYLTALGRITETFPRLPVAGEAGFLQASWYAERAKNYDPLGDTSHRFDLAKAKEICALYSGLPDSSGGPSHCAELTREITRQQMQLQTEKVNLPDLPFRTLFSGKNIPRLFLRVIRMDDATRENFETNKFGADTWKKLIRLPFLREQEVDLPATADFQQHRVEIPLQSLPKGSYALLAGADANFSRDAPLAVSYFYCSSLAFVHRNLDYFVADRNTGIPVAGARIKTFYSGYADNPREGWTLEAQYRTDAEGHARIKPEEGTRYGRHKIEFSTQTDFLTETPDEVYGYDNDEDEDGDTTASAFERKNMRASLFTDRGIYRPGQTVSVKVLLMTKNFNTRRYQVVPGCRSQLVLLDVNDQPVDSLAVQTGDFGSFAGQFRLPNAGLTGEYKIRDTVTGGQVVFQVEAYKRPKFYVSLDTPKAGYLPGDTVRISGSAMGYAGNAVSGASTTYRVYREARFPYPWLFRRGQASPEAEIAHGETGTDNAGHFTIFFPAIPDNAIARTARPVFSYRIEVQVTDLNGENREATTTVSVSAQSFEIAVEMPEKGTLPADSLLRLPVTTRNANGLFIPHSVTVSLFALQGPGRLIRERYWARPDLFLLGDTAWQRLFPADEYFSETDLTTWERGKKIAERTGLSQADGHFAFLVPGADKLTGWFLLIFSARDKNGDTIFNKRWIELGSEAATRPLVPVYNETFTQVINAEPGSDVLLRSGTAARKVRVIRAKVPLQDSLTTFSYYTLDDEIKQIPVRVGPGDVGGFLADDVFMINNRWYTSRHVVNVPWTEQTLRIGYSTWRDKTLPGAHETWSVNISGSKKETAEVLTAMYDASLDAFVPFSWSAPDIYPIISPAFSWNGAANFSQNFSTQKYPEMPWRKSFEKTYDGFFGGGSLNSRRALTGSLARVQDMSLAAPIAMSNAVSRKELQRERVDNLIPPPGQAAPDSISTPPPSPGPDPGSPIRKNFNETAFFFPGLKTDAKGDVSFSFTMPEALTRWKWSLFAHTRNLAFGLGEKTIITQKELMLLPNMPRFLRQGDSLQLPVKIVNLSAEPMTGTLRLDWRDAADSSERNTAFDNRAPEQSFSVAAGAGMVLFFPTVVSNNQQQPVFYRLVAKTTSGTSFSDGEEGILPVLGNRLLVTETLPLRLAGTDSATFQFEKLLHSDSSKSLQHQSLTVEYSTRPAWYAVQSLPYLMEFPYECAEQIFDRYYANALGRQIVRRVPGLAEVFAAWKASDTTALLSNLQKNPELKNVLLKETPWVVEAQSETAQRQQLARLLDSASLAAGLQTALVKLQDMQSEGGGFPWFAGGRDDRYITQYIVSGIGHLMQLQAVPQGGADPFAQLATKALAFLDREIRRDYDHRPKKAAEADIDPVQIQFLYLRSFFNNVEVPAVTVPALDYYRRQAVKYWPRQNMYLRGMIALALARTGDKKTAGVILASLRENARQSTSAGTYWKPAGEGFYWQESPVETQALLIEVFSELGRAGETEPMKWWLLQRKQATHWASTKATADACYALLTTGTDWLAADQQVTIHLGEQTAGTSSAAAQAGTGYFKTRFEGRDVTPAMGHISVNLAAASGKTVPSWGGVYWQYFEEMGKLTAAATGLAVSKSLFLQRNTDHGIVGEAVTAGAVLHPGDKLSLRITLRADRDLEYVQLKDQRAACLEPVTALSGYRWQADLNYYEAPDDESTSFFFDRLSKGVHVLEYPVYVTTSGRFTGGITTLQSMYAPELAAHTGGLSLKVKPK